MSELRTLEAHIDPDQTSIAVPMLWPWLLLARNFPEEPLARIVHDEFPQLEGEPADHHVVTKSEVSQRRCLDVGLDSGLDAISRYEVSAHHA